MRWIGALLCGACTQAVPSPVPAPPAEADAIYFVLVDRFSNGDTTNDHEIDLADPQGWHGGDIRGVLTQLDHIEAMGFRSVWLSPIHNGRHAKFHEWGAYHGYWVHDLDSIHPRFGDDAVVRELSLALEQRDMRLIVDMVYNHTGFDAPRRTTHPHWYHDTPGIENWSDPVERVTHQVHGLPDLAQEHPEVYAYFREQTTRMVKAFGVDGLRIDAVRHMPQSAFQSLHQDWTQDVGPSLQTIAEIFEGDAQALNTLWTEGGYSSAFNFPLHYALVETYCQEAHPGRMAATVDATLRLRPTGWVNFLDNHDVGRIASACPSQHSVLNALTAVLLAPGTPMVTYGTESGLMGAKEPENRADMDFEQTPLAQAIANTLQVRRDTPALYRGHRRSLEVSETHWVDLRWTESDSAAVIANVSESPVHITLPWSEGALPLGGAQWVDGTLVVAPKTTTVALAEAAHSMPAEPQTVKWVAPQTQGEGIPRLVGNHPQLGNWDPKRAPTWTDGVLALTIPEGTTVAYKLVWELPDHSLRWEDGPNRYHFVTANAAPVVLDRRVRVQE